MRSQTLGPWTSPSSAQTLMWEGMEDETPPAARDILKIFQVSPYLWQMSTALVGPSSQSRGYNGK